MILIFEPDLYFIRWCRVENGHFDEYKCKFETLFSGQVLEDLEGPGEIEAIVYFLRHGGDVIKEAAVRLTPEYVSKLQETIRFLPEHNDSTFKIIKYFSKKFPDISHILLCDTAFFADLPEEARSYAIPAGLRDKGIRRYGGWGLCHQWACEKTAASSNRNAKRTISVYLGNNTNIAAIKDGRPIETSIGFTPVEGIPSQTSCGDIDPTIVFYLKSTGMSFEEINRVLSGNSGFKALLGEHCAFPDVLKYKGLARDLYFYSVIVHIGAFISVLGGIDELVFVSEYPEESSQLIAKICRKLDFSGFKSKIKVFRFAYNKWEIMHSLAKAVIKPEA